MEIRLIWAMDREGGIGRENRLPWSFPKDLRRFKERTMGFPIVMGRKTFESLPSGPLPGRLNLVMSRSGHQRDSPDGAVWFDNPDSVIEYCRNGGWAKIYVIGGEEIFRLFLNRADYLEVTRIGGNFACDRFFPETDWSRWRLISTEREGNLTFQVYFAKRAR